MTSTRKIDQVTDGDWMLLTHANALLGLSPAAISKWMQRHGVYHRWTRKHGKYRVISVAALERYEQATGRANVERVSSRPPGWVGVEAAADLARTSNARISKAAQRGEIKAVRHGFYNWYDPDSVEQFRLHFHNYPLPGWEEIGVYAAKHGADREAIKLWLTNRKHRIRKFRSHSTKQIVRCALNTGLQEWETHYLERARLGITGRKLTEGQVRVIRERLAAGEGPFVIAHDYPVTYQVISQIRDGITYRGVGLLLERAA